jgi:hypothetical protein
VKFKHALALGLFLVAWTVIDMPFYIAKRLGLPVKEIGE